MSRGVIRRPDYILSFNHQTLARLGVNVQRLRLRGVAINYIKASHVPIVSPFDLVQVIHKRIGL
jgi:hypothetical protein